MGRVQPLLVIRVGIAFVFLWFGASKVVQPEAWVSWLPRWMAELPVSVTANLVFQGAVEAVVGLMLLFGLLTRVASAVAALIMIAVIAAIGFNEIAVRDFAILTIAVALAVAKSHPLSLDSYLRIRWKKA